MRKEKSQSPILSLYKVQKPSARVTLKNQKLIRRADDRESSIRKSRENRVTLGEQEKTSFWVTNCYKTIKTQFIGARVTVRLQYSLLGIFWVTQERKTQHVEICNFIWRILQFILAARVTLEKISAVRSLNTNDTTILINARYILVNYLVTHNYCSCATNSDRLYQTS